MKFTKLLGLAAVAALAVMALVGASSASASIVELTACKTNTKLCPTASIVREIHATASNAKLLGTINQNCTSSLTILKEQGLGTATSIVGNVTTLTFTGCEPCSSITTTPPYKASISSSTLSTGGSATLTGCPFGINCKFGAEKVELSLVKNGEGAVIEAVASEEPLTLQEGSKFFCGSTGKWDAKYVLTTPVYLVPERQVA